MLTDKGRDTFDAAMRLQAPEANDLSEGLSIADIGTAARVVAALRGTLEGEITNSG